MKKAIYLLSSVLFSISLLSTNLQASAIKGKIFYAQNLKQSCGFTGELMGKKHTISEWKKFYETNTLNDALKATCPKMLDVTTEKDLTNLYHFLSSFASDSGNVPSCN